MTYTIYELLGTVVREDGVVVSPCQSIDDPNFIAYKQWIEEGNSPIVDRITSPEPEIVEPSIPESVSSLQLRIALNQLNLRMQVESAIVNESQDVKDLWEYAPRFYYSNPILNAFAKAMGINLGDVFLLASSFTNY